MHLKRVGSFLLNHPSEKICSSQIWVHLPPIFGMNIKIRFELPPPSYMVFSRFFPGSPTSPTPKSSTNTTFPSSKGFTNFASTRQKFPFASPENAIFVQSLKGKKWYRKYRIRWQFYEVDVRFFFLDAVITL